MKSFIGLKIVEFKLLNYNIIQIFLTDGSTYTGDLSSFNNVYCYPQKNEWNQAVLSDHKTDIEWPSGFGIHLDQIAALSLINNKSVS